MKVLIIVCPTALKARISISPYQKEVFRRSDLGRMLFEQLSADGQRLTFFVKQEHEGAP